MTQRGRRLGGKVLRIGGVLLAAAMATGAAAITWDALQDAYGSGPPYYDRTTNMDKWSNPVPTLLCLDGVVLVLVAGVLFAIQRIRQPSARREEG
jgi:hypothetical protein